MMHNNGACTFFQGLLNSLASMEIAGSRFMRSCRKIMFDQNQKVQVGGQPGSV